jgi:hypothetical protein
MLYIVGGASRAGKSTVARRLLTQHQIPYLPTDMIMMGLAQGMPELGIDPDQSQLVRGEQLWPVLRAMAGNSIANNTDYLLEGDVLLATRRRPLEQQRLSVGAPLLTVQRAAPQLFPRSGPTPRTPRHDWLHS